MTDVTGETRAAVLVSHAVEWGEDGPHALLVGMSSALLLLIESDRTRAPRRAGDVWVERSNTRLLTASYM